MKCVGLSCIDSVRCVAVVECEDDSTDLQKFVKDLIVIVVVVVVAFLVIVYIVLLTVVYMIISDRDKSFGDWFCFICHGFCLCCLLSSSV